MTSEQKLRDASFTLSWHPRQTVYTVSKPNIGTQDVVPLAVALEVAAALEAAPANAPTFAEVMALQTPAFNDFTIPQRHDWATRNNAIGEVLALYKSAAPAPSSSEPAYAPSLPENAYKLAMLALQSERYAEDADYRESVDNILANTLPARTSVAPSSSTQGTPTWEERVERGAKASTPFWKATGPQRRERIRRQVDRALRAAFPELAPQEGK